MSTEFCWSEEYSVDVPEIDDQHKILFELIDRLDRAIKERRGSAACEEILGELIEYTKVHFSLEEALMRLANYPKFAEHCQLHSELIAEVEAMSAKVKDGQVAISFELMQFLRNWLTKHILKEDKQYSAYFGSSGFCGDSQWSKDAERASAEKKRKWWKFW